MQKLLFLVDKNVAFIHVYEFKWNSAILKYQITLKCALTVEEFLMAFSKSFHGIVVSIPLTFSAYGRIALVPTT